MSTTAEALWSAGLDALRGMLKPEIFALWFAPLRAQSLVGETLTIEVADEFTEMWLKDNYLDLLRSVVSRAAVKPMYVSFVIAPPGSHESFSSQVHGSSADASNFEPAYNRNGSDLGRMPHSPTVSAPVPEPARQAERYAGDFSLQPNNTFSTFVVGNNNEFAHSASRAVASSPGKAFNPLFLFGGVGLGKTHLLHAIGHEIINTKRQAKVAYLSCERFTNEFIAALQENQLVKFRRKYRLVDALLVDDIQFLAGKERIQEEFFHTFNTLHEARKQIVLTCDRPASEIPGLEQRLISRFEWGQTADLRPPDVETRLAILRKKEQSLGIPLPPDILNFLAERIRTNIRRLEGAFVRVSAYAQLTRVPLTVSVVETLLREILQEEGKQTVTIESIQKRVADHYDIRLADMTSKRRPENIAFPRQVAMYLSRQLTDASLSAIGECFGGRDHGTVLHACRAVKDRMEVDSTVRQAIGYLENQLVR
jgi:chromosomal replication initiator protein